MLGSYRQPYKRALKRLPSTILMPTMSNTTKSTDVTAIENLRNVRPGYLSAIFNADSLTLCHNSSAMNLVAASTISKLLAFKETKKTEEIY